jgi:1,4-dihydroxy-2-naphthoate octaprenyltransferase
MVETTKPSAGSVWLSAARPRTLPLAVASIIMGTSLAAASGAFNLWIGLLCFVTAILLQILSNLANDYGDSLHGADSVERLGPARAVQSGLVTAAQMRRAMIIVAALALVSGLLLLWLAFRDTALSATLVFVLLGGAAVAAAITYTAGKLPYGYAGLGDLAVLVFFGWVGVLGSYYVQATSLDPLLILPATSCGLLAVAVLNVNNIRDMASDQRAGKYSVPVRVGLERARLYHWLLLLLPVALAVVYVLVTGGSVWEYLFLLAAPLLVRNGLVIQRATDLPALNPWLKQMSLATLVFVILFSAGQLLGNFMFTAG